MFVQANAFPALATVRGLNFFIAVLLCGRAQERSADILSSSLHGTNDSLPRCVPVSGQECPRSFSNFLQTTRFRSRGSKPKILDHQPSSGSRPQTQFAASLKNTSVLCLKANRGTASRKVNPTRKKGRSHRFALSSSSGSKLHSASLKTTTWRSWARRYSGS